ncbi:MAG: serine protease [candidate division NC10 bacterium]|nr:serine protease [candidate division NC10 bacterium]
MCRPTGRHCSHKQACGRSINRSGVSYATGVEEEAHVIRSFKDVDLAFLKVKRPARQVIPLGNEQALKVGQDVFTVGNPISIGLTLTRGTISALGRLVEGVSYIQIAAALNPGNSGGPLCDMSGQAVGIITLKFQVDPMTGDPVEGIAFALPATIITSRLAKLPEIRDMKDQIYCPICGEINLKVKYCVTCGVELAYFHNAEQPRPEKITEVAACPVCHTPRQIGKNYCLKCGASLLQKG